MRFLIITHVAHTKADNQYFAYAPYVWEMNIWLKHASEVMIVAPLQRGIPSVIDNAYRHERICFLPAPKFNFTSFYNGIKALWVIPGILMTIGRAMRQADHIHLRCPGNMGLLGCLMQIFFPKKIKSVKYAGEWPDYKNEPFSYRIQKYITKNVLLSKNMKVLVYGAWSDFTSNCKPFFTASYTESDAKSLIIQKNIEQLAPVKIVFVGTLDERKRPDYSIETVIRLKKLGYKTEAALFGEGPYRTRCLDLIQNNGIEDSVRLFGNIPPRDLIPYYREAHFLVFLSRMEGWPKVVAEAMFWGCVPVTTAISCVPWMLGNGERGCIVDRNPQAASEAIEALILNKDKYSSIQAAGIAWARQYTLERFEREIIEILH